MNTLVLQRDTAVVVPFADIQALPKTGDLTADQAEIITVFVYQRLQASQQHLNAARLCLLHLHERHGWKALGFDSWMVFVKTCFPSSVSHCYRLLDAAKREQELNLPIGSIAESVLRPLCRLPDVATRRKVWKQANDAALHGNSPLTANW